MLLYVLRDVIPEIVELIGSHVVRGDAPLKQFLRLEPMPGESEIHTQVDIVVDPGEKV